MCTNNTIKGTQKKTNVDLPLKKNLGKQKAKSR